MELVFLASKLSYYYTVVFHLSQLLYIIYFLPGPVCLPQLLSLSLSSSSPKGNTATRGNITTTSMYLHSTYYAAVVCYIQHTYLSVSQPSGVHLITRWWGGLVHHPRAPIYAAADVGVNSCINRPSVSSCMYGQTRQAASPEP